MSVRAFEGRSVWLIRSLVVLVCRREDTVEFSSWPLADRGVYRQTRAGGYWNGTPKCGVGKFSGSARVHTDLTLERHEIGTLFYDSLLRIVGSTF